MLGSLILYLKGMSGGGASPRTPPFCAVGQPPCALRHFELRPECP